MALPDDDLVAAEQLVAGLERDLGSYRRLLDAFATEMTSLKDAWQSPYGRAFQTECGFVLDLMLNFTVAFRHNINRAGEAREALRQRIVALQTMRQQVQRWFAARPDLTPSDPASRPRWVTWPYNPDVFRAQGWTEADPRWELAHRDLRERGCAL